MSVETPESDGLMSDEAFAEEFGEVSEDDKQKMSEASKQHDHPKTYELNPDDLDNPVDIPDEAPKVD